MEGQGGEALERFLRISELDPSCYPALLGAVELAERRGRAGQVLSYANQLLERFPKKLRVARAALKVLVSLDRYERADTLLSAAISRFSEDRELLLLRAVLLEKMGDAERAMRLIRGYEREGEETSETLLVRARVAADREDYREAEQLAQRGIASYPGIYEFLILRSEILVATGRGEEAYGLLRERWSEETWNMQLLYRLLELAVRLERWEDGEEYLRRLMEYSPEDYDVLKAAVQLYGGRGRTEEALSYAQELIESFAGEPTAVTVYLDTLLDAGREQDLRAYVNRRLENSDSSEVRSILYLYLSEVQDGTGAKIASLQSALYENMQNTRALIRISELYRQQGDTAKAARYLRQAVASRPDDEELQDRLRRLEAQLE
jgi:predicted Zn-dependent protease